jgi:hypothetical protein
MNVCGGGGGRFFPNRAISGRVSVSVYHLVTGNKERDISLHHKDREIQKIRKTYNNWKWEDENKCSDCSTNLYLLI